MSAPLPHVPNLPLRVDFELLSSGAKLICVTLMNEHPREPTWINCFAPFCSVMKIFHWRSSAANLKYFFISFQLEEQGVWWHTNNECSLDGTNRSWKANAVAQLLTVNTALQTACSNCHGIRLSSEGVKNGTAAFKSPEDWCVFCNWLISLVWDYTGTAALQAAWIVSRSLVNRKSVKQDLHWSALSWPIGQKFPPSFPFISSGRLALSPLHLVVVLLNCVLLHTARVY